MLKNVQFTLTLWQFYPQFVTILLSGGLLKKHLTYEVRILGECGVQLPQAEIYVWGRADKQDKHDRYWERLTKPTEKIFWRGFTETKKICFKFFYIWTPTSEKQKKYPKIFDLDNNIILLNCFFINGMIYLNFVALGFKMWNETHNCFFSPQSHIWPALHSSG